MNATNYVCYRLPEQKEYVRLEQHEGEPLALKSVKELGGRQGFVFAPFQPSDETPVWLLQADKAEQKTVGNGDVDGEDGTGHDGVSDNAEQPSNWAEYVKLEHENYHLRFGLCKEYFRLGEVKKVVIARHVFDVQHAAEDPEELFLRACRLYPHQYIALVCLEHAGTWLMATPEVLIEGDGTHYHTMALAGTMKMPDSYQPRQEMKWSEKNRKEQRLVASYIGDTLQPFADELTHSHPHTTMAARLLHLRTDFDFTLKEDVPLADVLDALHPTPAVCGLPKEAAKELILKHEADKRKYYSGFCGPYDPKGDTRLFVTLRCMEINDDAYVLHAGGGIVPESKENEEWRETEMKLNTMRDVLR